jgi:acetylornithine deacetylase/succinyl-diaminopimelate desuccinylase-like protein
MRPLQITLVVMVLLTSRQTSAQNYPLPDLKKAHEETLAILQGLVRIDTTNPPGNETKAAEYLKSILDKEGIPAEIFAKVPERGNLVARLKGSGRKRPLLLMGHTDVVGVEREKWTVDPFEGVVKDGYLYGRGASDDKAMTAVAVEVMLMLRRMDIALDRDVILLAAAGEEGTTEFGIDFMVDQHWEKIDSEYALNEGGVIRVREADVHFVGVSASEKVPRTTRLVARGTSGHGSIPLVDNPVVRIAAAVAKLGQHQLPMRLNETTRAFFQRLATISPPEQSALFSNLEDQMVSPRIQEKLRSSDPTYNAMLRTSISPNIIKGGFQRNIIPGDAEATLDIRALPDEDLEKLFVEIRRIIDDPTIDVLPALAGRPATQPSRLDSDLFKALEKAQTKLFPGSITLPMMLPGATDSAQLRARGVQAYGIGTLKSEDDEKRIHGNDERVWLEGVNQFFEFMWTAIAEVAIAK